MTMNLVSFYEIAHGDPSECVRVGTGSVEEVRSMERPPCYLSLHVGLAADQPIVWARLGFAVLDEVSKGFKNIEQEGLERHGAPASLVFQGARFINRVLTMVRAFADEAMVTDSERWFAIDAAHHDVTPVSEQEAWDALACPGPSNWWERVSYISVKGPEDDLHSVFDGIVMALQEELRQTQMDTEAS